MRTATGTDYLGDGTIGELQSRARRIRRHIVRMIGTSGSGHPGGSLSAADIVAALYFHYMRVDPRCPEWPERDRFILSKGHCCPVIYAALAERGYFDCGNLDSLRCFQSILQGHPCIAATPGLDMTSGSLGNGLSLGVGMALGGRVDSLDYRVFVMLGDGEMQEGMVWEAMMSAAHFKLENLYMIVDYNHLQVDGTIEQVMDIAPLREKLEAFGWRTLEVDGHDMEDILRCFDSALEPHEGPTAIIAHTVKGKGVSFMENRVEWHGLAPTQEQVVSALEEIGGDEPDE